MHGVCNQWLNPGLSSHSSSCTCTQGKMEIICLEEKVKRPQIAFEKAFYPKGNASVSSMQWIKHEALQRGRHIHYHLCGHGGEHCIAGVPVDRYELTTKMVFQYHGCQWHECSTHGKKGNAPELYAKTLMQGMKIQEAGYKLAVMWECAWKRPELRPLLVPQFKVYLHGILYNFESYLDKTLNIQPQNSSSRTCTCRSVPLGIKWSGSQPTFAHGILNAGFGIYSRSHAGWPYCGMERSNGFYQMAST